MAGYNTKELRRAKKKGAKIVTDEDGKEVRYAPRVDQRFGDHKPWVRIGDPEAEDFRLRPGECHPEGQNGEPWVLAELLTFERS